MDWIEDKPFGLFLPALTDEFMGSEAGERLQALDYVVSLEGSRVEGGTRSIFTFTVIPNPVILSAGDAARGKASPESKDPEDVYAGMSAERCFDEETQGRTP